MVRFIFFCMAILALSVAAIPLTTVFDGISKERAETLADAAPAMPAQPDPDYFAASPSAAPAEDELNAIEAAAGEADRPNEDSINMQGGFSNTSPAALADDAAAAAPAAAPAPQEN